jgi:hypothetical protein
MHVVCIYSVKKKIIDKTYRNPFHGPCYETNHLAPPFVHPDAPDWSQRRGHIVILSMRLCFARLLMEEPIIAWRRFDKTIIDIPLGSITLRDRFLDLFNWAREATFKAETDCALSDATDWREAKQTRRASHGRPVRRSKLGDGR